MSRTLLAVAAILISFATYADRVRVVVALDSPAASFAIQSDRATLIESLRTASHVEPWGNGRAFAAELDREELETLARDPRVRAISIDTGGEGALMQSVPLIGADLVRAQGFDGRGVTVAVLDTGIDINNRDFAGRIFGERCFCDNLDGTGCCPNGRSQQEGTGAALDDHGHGTHVSGIVAGGGTLAPAGVAPAAGIVAVKVMGRDNSFKSFTQIYRALEWIDRERRDVRVINMSLGSFALYKADDCGRTAIALGMEDVITRLRSRGVLITASTGNQGSKSELTLPACMHDVLGVGAIYDTPGSYSYYGCQDSSTHSREVTCFTNSNGAVDLVAPGAPIASARRGGGSVSFAGTSMAAPHVAGVLVLMQQASAGKLTAELAEQILESTGKPALDRRNGLTFPSLDAAAALSATPRAQPDPKRRSVRP